MEKQNLKQSVWDCRRMRRVFGGQIRAYVMKACSGISPSGCWLEAVAQTQEGPADTYTKLHEIKGSTSAPLLSASNPETFKQNSSLPPNEERTAVLPCEMIKGFFFSLFHSSHQRSESPEEGRCKWRNRTALTSTSHCWNLSLSLHWGHGRRALTQTGDDCSTMNRAEY